MEASIAVVRKSRSSCKHEQGKGRGSSGREQAGECRIQTQQEERKDGPSSAVPPGTMDTEQ